MAQPEPNTVLLGDSTEVLKQFPDNCFSAVVCDPPYGLSAQPDMREVLKHWMAGDDYEHGGSGFMGKSWDSFVPGPKLWAEVFRVLKPGGHVLSFSGTRTYDLMVTAMRLASFDVRDKLDYYLDVSGYRSWTYGSGFPKSHDIGKATGDEKWSGYGSALKPAHEPVAQFSKANEDGTMPESPDAPPFSYTAKPASRERNKGCSKLYWCGDDMIDKAKHTELKAENAERKDEEGFKPHKLSRGNIHPTVKPIELCRYLVKMVKMPGDNLILDPFCGSGSTLCAAVLEGCDFVGIDMSPFAVEISQRRARYYRLLGESGL